MWRRRKNKQLKINFSPSDGNVTSLNPQTTPMLLRWSVGQFQDARLRRCLWRVREEHRLQTRGTKPSDGPAGESQTVRIICGRHVKNMNLKQKVRTKNHQTPGTGPRSAPWLTAHTNQQVIRSTSTNSSCSWMFLNVTASRTKSCSAFKTFDFSQVCRNKRFKYSFKISV